METVNVEPNWDGMRRFVQNIAKTDPATARKIAAEMGDEAPYLDPCEECGTPGVDGELKGPDGRAVCDPCRDELGTYDEPTPPRAIDTDRITEPPSGLGTGTR
jgi:hypothetical protein